MKIAELIWQKFVRNIVYFIQNSNKLFTKKLLLNIIGLIELLFRHVRTAVLHNEIELLYPKRISF